MTKSAVAIGQPATELVRLPLKRAGYYIILAPNASKGYRCVLPNSSLAKQTEILKIGMRGVPEDTREEYITILN